MKLRSLRVKNFLSFGEEPAEMKFGDGGVTFVVGPNNSGKSNIFRTLGFVADSFATWYPNVSPTPFLHNGRRDFEISVRVALNEAELQAVKDFIVCANTLYQFGGEPPESQLKARIRNEILTKHGGKLLRDFGNEVTLVVKGTEQQNIQFRHFLLLNWGKEQFLLQRDNYLSKTEMPETSGFGYAIFSELLVDDFKKRHPIELKDVGESDRVLDGAYAPPSVPELLASRLATEASKAGQSVFAGIQVEQLSFNAFEQRHGVAEPLKRLRNFLSVKGLLKDQITFNDLFAMIYTSSIVWVPDMRGSPPH